MKLGQNMCPNNILDEFENGSSWMKNMATDLNICSNNSLSEFENGYGLLKNMAARGRQLSLHVYGFSENLLTLY